MPQDLNNRIEDLENQVKHFLATQKCSVDACCKIIRGKSVTRHSDGNVEQIEFEGTTCPGAKASSNPLTSAEASSSNNEVNEFECGCGEKNRTKATSGDRSSSPKARTFKSEDIKGSGKGAVKKDEKEQADSNSKSLKSDKRSTALSVSEKQQAHGRSLKSDKRSKSSKAGTGGKVRKQKDKTKKGKKGGSTRKNLKAEKELKESLKKLQDYEALMAEQTAKLKKMSANLKEIEKAKQMALKSTTELKGKYEQLRTSKVGEKEEIENLLKEKEGLIKQLQEESEKIGDLEKTVKDAVQKERKSLTEKVEQIELQAVKSAKKLKKQGKQLTSAVKCKDNDIRRLSETTVKLAESIREREAENKKLLEAQKEMFQNFLNAQEANKILVSNNEILIRSIKGFQAKLHFEKTLVEKMQKDLSDCKAESQKFSQEITRLKEKLREALQGAISLRRWEKLKAKLREAQLREQLSMDEAAVLAMKMQEVVQNKGEANQDLNSVIDRMMKDQKKLQSKFDLVMKQLQMAREEDALKIKTMKEELERFTQEANKKENRLTRDISGLQFDYDNLSDAAAEDQEAIGQLEDYTHLQDRVIISYTNYIASKKKKIELMQNDIKNSKAQIIQLENRIPTLKKDIVAAEEHAEQQRKQMEELKAQSSEVREQILAKDNIIAEQTSKIEELNANIDEIKLKINLAAEETRISFEETRISIEQRDMLTVQLETEKEAMAELTYQMNGKVNGKMNGIDQVGIKTRAKKVSGILNEICKCDANAVDTQLMEVYEEKVALVQQETDLQIKLAIKQRDQVVNAARLATERLLEAATDFQNQVEIHKKVQYMFTKMLKEKEQQLQKRHHRSRRSTPTNGQRSPSPCKCGG